MQEMKYILVISKDLLKITIFNFHLYNSNYFEKFCTVVLTRPYFVIVTYWLCSTLSVYTMEIFLLYPKFEFNTNFICF